jgi:hypothetical protein
MAFLFTWAGGGVETKRVPLESKKSTFTSPLLITALVITGAIATWGLIDAEGLAAGAARLVHVQFFSRGWFINAIIDTLMNIVVFVFVGFLVWLYFKPVDDNNDSAD